MEDEVRGRYERLLRARDDRSPPGMAAPFRLVGRTVGFDGRVFRKTPAACHGRPAAAALTEELRELLLGGAVVG